MSDGELAQIYKHALYCEECLIKLREAPVLDEMIKMCEYFISFDWQENICDPAYEEPDHLSFQERSRYVRDELDEANRMLVQVHIEDCRMCAEEVRDLKAFVASLDEHSVKRGG